MAEGATGGSIVVNAWAGRRGNVGGWYGVLILAAFMALYCGYRFWDNIILVPMGLMAALSLIALVLLVVLRPRGRQGRGEGGQAEPLQGANILWRGRTECGRSSVP